MSRSTIDFGIDLGTTNSEIAVFDGTSTEIIKNGDNVDNTSSAVWIDKHGDVVVGQRAKDMFQRDRANAKVKFKLLMGSKDHLHFAASGKKLLPEELSAEVLKELKGNVREKLQEDIYAAVITAPADFAAPQIEAKQSGDTRGI